MSSRTPAYTYDDPAYVCTQHFVTDHGTRYIDNLNSQSISYIQRVFLKKSGGIDILTGNSINNILWAKTCSRKRALHCELHEEFLYYQKPSDIYNDMKKYR